MKKIIFLLCLFGMAISGYTQPVLRNVFTTNTGPSVITGTGVSTNADGTMVITGGGGGGGVSTVAVTNLAGPTTGLSAAISGSNLGLSQTNGTNISGNAGTATLAANLASGATVTNLTAPNIHVTSGLIDSSAGTTTITNVVLKDTNGNTMPSFASLVTNGASGVTLSGNFGPNRTNEIWVSLFGSDFASVGWGSYNNPLLTMTNATNFAAMLGGTNLIHVGVGNYPIPNSFTVGTNTSVCGAGSNATTLVFPISSQAVGLVVWGDNVTLRDFTLGSPNPNNGTFYFPLVLRGGTNFNSLFLNAIGDSDCLYAAGTTPNLKLTNLFQGIFTSCHFSSGYDSGNVNCFSSTSYSSSFDFEDCCFDVVYDSVFTTGINLRCFNVQGVSANPAVIARNCVFNNNNAGNLGANYGIQYAANGGSGTLLLQNNIYNCGGYAGSAGVVGNGTVPITTIRGGINPTNLLAINSNIITFDSSQWLTVTASNFVGDGSAVTNLRSSNTVVDATPYTNISGMAFNTYYTNLTKKNGWLSTTFSFISSATGFENSLYIFTPGFAYSFAPKVWEQRAGTGGFCTNATYGDILIPAGWIFVWSNNDVGGSSIQTNCFIVP